MKFYLVFSILFCLSIEAVSYNLSKQLILTSTNISSIKQFMSQAPNLGSIENGTAIDSSDHVFLYMRALAKEASGDWEGILADLNNAIGMSPQPEYYNFRALVFAHLLKYAQAHQDFDEAIRLNPNYATAYYNKGMLYFNQNESLQACAEMNKALQAKSFDAKIFIKEFCQ
jgi:tetratricopeptide (TPR) repeat protein